MLTLHTTPVESHSLQYAKSQDLVDNKDGPRHNYMSHGTHRPASAIAPPSPGSPINLEGLNLEINRLKTFDEWAVPFIDKRFLARTGFYYIGRGDLVKCYFCTVEIGMWEVDDNPVEEHLKWSANCRLMNGCETTNVPIDAEAFKRALPQISFDTCGLLDLHPSAYVESSGRTSQSPPPSSSQTPLEAETLTRRPEHPEYQIESHRLGTYEDWPKTMKQKPKVLAEAGFYYTGKGDRVICFSCGGGLKHWEEIDEPWEQHAMWYPKCEYLALMKGKPYIDEILARKNTPSGSFSESAETENVVEPKVSTSVETSKPAAAVDDKRLCKICYENEYNTAFVPCGHILACAKCATSVTKCPNCRQPFTQVIRIYMS